MIWDAEAYMRRIFDFIFRLYQSITEVFNKVSNWTRRVENRCLLLTRVISCFYRFLYGTAEGRKLLENSSQFKDIPLSKWIHNVIEAVENIYDYWLEYRKASLPVLQPVKRVSRNDPCPCGSRKKYKNAVSAPSLRRNSLTG